MTAGTPHATPFLMHLRGFLAKSLYFELMLARLLMVKEFSEITNPWFEKNKEYWGERHPSKYPPPCS
jgi:hypothetical protein